MFSLRIGSLFDNYKTDFREEAMSLFREVYKEQLRVGHELETALKAAEAAAESYMAQVNSFKERGL